MVLSFSFSVVICCCCWCFAFGKAWATHTTNQRTVGFVGVIRMASMAKRYYGKNGQTVLWWNRKLDQNALFWAFVRLRIFRWISLSLSLYPPPLSIYLYLAKGKRAAIINRENVEYIVEKAPEIAKKKEWTKNLLTTRKLLRWTNYVYARTIFNIKLTSG